MRAVSLVLLALAPIPALAAISRDATCGGKTTCLGSKWGNCCSQYNWCGSTADYCGTGCQSKFGLCNGLPPSRPSSSSSRAISIRTTSTRATSTRATSTRATSTRTSVAAPSSTQKVTSDARCGPSYKGATCLGSKWGNCCSQYSYCGSTIDYCEATTCQKGFGLCNEAVSSSSRVQSSTFQTSSTRRSSSASSIASSSVVSSSSSIALSSNTPSSSIAASSSSVVASSSSSEILSSSSAAPTPTPSSSSLSSSLSPSSSDAPPSSSPEPSSSASSSAVPSSSDVQSSSIIQTPTVVSSSAGSPEPTTTQLVVNPNFETPDPNGGYYTSPWQTTGQVVVQSRNNNAYTGYEGTNFVVLYGYAGLPCSLSQVLTDISTTRTYDLSYYYAVKYVEGECTFSVSIDGVVVDTMVSPAFSLGNYQLRSVTLPPFTANTAVLKFAVDCPQFGETYNDWALDVITVTRRE